MKKISVLSLLLVICIFLFPNDLAAQGLPCDGGDPYEECPIDTNIIALVAGGLGIGWLAIRKQLV